MKYIEYEKEVLKKVTQNLTEDIDAYLKTLRNGSKYTRCMFYSDKGFKKFMKDKKNG